MRYPKQYDDEFLNIVKQLIDLAQQTGIKVQDLVAEGQLTPEQYATLIQSVNGLISKGNVSPYDINKNLGKFDATFFSSEFLEYLNKGTIDATKILPGSVTNESLVPNAVAPHNISEGNINIYNEADAFVGFTSDLASGGLTSNATWTATNYIPVNQGDVIRINKALYVYATTYNFNKIIVNQYATTGSVPKELEITIPSGVAYIIINVVNAQKNGFMVTKNNPMPANYIPFVTKTADWLELTEKNMTDNIVKNSHITQKEITPDKFWGANILSERSINRFDKSSVIRGVAATVNGDTSNSAWAATDYIAVTPGDIIRGNIVSNVYLVTYNSNKSALEQLNNGSAATPFSYTIPSGVSYLRLNSTLERIDQFMFTINEELPSTYDPYSELKVDISWMNHSEGPRKEEDWSGSKWLTLGDSITWQDSKVYSGTSNIAVGYQTIIKGKLGFSTVVNRGVSGRPMANGTSNGVGTNTTGKESSYVGMDLVTIAAGTNDFKLNVPLGVQGQLDDTTFDTNTFYGAYRDLIEHILNVRPHVRISLWTPLQRKSGGYDVNHTNTAGHKLIDYVNAIKNIGEMYSIPVCDLYRNSGITHLNLNYYTLDGLHPNDLGYNRIGSYAAEHIQSIGR